MDGEDFYGWVLGNQRQGNKPHHSNIQDYIEDSKPAMQPTIKSIDLWKTTNHEHQAKTLLLINLLHYVGYELITTA